MGHHPHRAGSAGRHGRDPVQRLSGYGRPLSHGRTRRRRHTGRLRNRGPLHRRPPQGQRTCRIRLFRNGRAVPAPLGARAYGRCRPEKLAVRRTRTRGPEHVYFLTPLPPARHGTLPARLRAFGPQRQRTLHAHDLDLPALPAIVLGRRAAAHGPLFPRFGKDAPFQGTGHAGSHPGL